MRHLLRLAMVGLLLVVASCGDDDAPLDAGTGGPSDGDASRDDDRDSIEGDYIATEATEHGDPRALVPGTEIRLRLHDGRLGVNAGCNSIGGDYTLRDDVLEVAAMSMTEMGCDEPRHAQDQWIADFLSSSPTVEPIEEGMVLSTPTTEITFLDRAVVEPDVELVDTTWEVTGFVSGPGPDGTASSVSGEPGSVVFGHNGFVSGHDGCNGFGFAGEPGGEPTDGLRYEVDGDRITFTGSAVTTKAACPDIDTESFWAVLAGTVTFEVEASNLTLTAADGRGATFRAVQN